MSEIEKIKKYVAETEINPDAIKQYTIYLSDIQAFYEAVQIDSYKTIMAIFEYGRAKGYRAAKAEARK